jgi:PAS domain S-box-containing protein
MTNDSSTSSTSDKANDGLESTHVFPDGRACFRELMSNVNMFAVTFNQQAEIIYCNGHFVRMTGLSLDEIMGRGWNDVFVSPGAANIQVPFPRLLSGNREALYHESDLLTRAGERYWVRWNSIPLRDSSGSVVGVASIGEDITERRRLERALLDSSAREPRNLEGELHDGLGQELFGLALSARGLAASAKKRRRIDCGGSRHHGRTSLSERGAC